MRAGEQLLFLEQPQVAPHRGFRDRQLLGQLADPYRAMLIELLQNQPESILLSHALHVTRTGMLTSSAPRRRSNPVVQCALGAGGSSSTAIDRPPTTVQS